VPDDPDAYRRLMNRIYAAQTEADLFTLAHDILVFTGGVMRLDFGETWRQNWQRVAGKKPIPPGIWPPVAVMD